MRTELKLLRVRYGLTQEQMAVRLGCKRCTYAAVENGKREPSMRFCNALSMAFGMPMAEVLELLKPDEK